MPPDSNFPSPTPFYNPTIPSADQPVVVTAKSSTPKKKYFLAGLVVLTLIAGVITAVFLVQRQARLKTLAWNCSAYNFNVSRAGVVTVSNQSQYSEPSQEVGITINDSPAGIFDVPALAQGESSTLGNVTVPESGAFSWEAVGTIDCQDSGTYLATPTACNVVFDEPNRLYCKDSPDQVTVSGTIVSAPEGSTLQKAWNIVNPSSKKTDSVYSSESASNGKKFTITGTWPGFSDTDSVVEIHFGANILDSNGNPHPNCTASLDYYWYPNRCEPSPSPTESISPTVSPTIEPTATITTTPPIGGPDPSPTPTSVPGPTSTPGPTGVPDPTATPIVNNPPATPTPVTQLPATGSIDFTWLLTTTGLILLGVGALILVF